MVHFEQETTGLIKVYDDDGFICGDIQFLDDSYQYQQGSDIFVHPIELRAIADKVDLLNAKINEGNGEPNV